MCFFGGGLICYYCCCFVIDLIDARFPKLEVLSGGCLVGSELWQLLSEYGQQLKVFSLLSPFLTINESYDDLNWERMPVFDWILNDGEEKQSDDENEDENKNTNEDKSNSEKSKKSENENKIKKYPNSKFFSMLPNLQVFLVESFMQHEKFLKNMNEWIKLQEKFQTMWLKEHYPLYLMKINNDCQYNQSNDNNNIKSNESKQASKRDINAPVVLFDAPIAVFHISDWIQPGIGRNILNKREEWEINWGYYSLKYHAYD